MLHWGWQIYQMDKYKYKWVKFWIFLVFSDWRGFCFAVLLSTSSQHLFRCAAVFSRSILSAPVHILQLRLLISRLRWKYCDDAVKLHVLTRTSWTLCTEVNKGVPHAADELNVVSLMNLLFWQWKGFIRPNAPAVLRWLKTHLCCCSAGDKVYFHTADPSTTQVSPNKQNINEFIVFLSLKGRLASRMTEMTQAVWGFHSCLFFHVAIGCRARGGPTEQTQQVKEVQHEEQYQSYTQRELRTIRQRQVCTYTEGGETTRQRWHTLGQAVRWKRWGTGQDLGDETNFTQITCTYRKPVHWMKNMSWQCVWVSDMNRDNRETRPIGFWMSYFPYWFNTNK